MELLENQNYRNSFFLLWYFSLLTATTFKMHIDNMTSFWALNIYIYIIYICSSSSHLLQLGNSKVNALMKWRALLHFSIYNMQLHSAWYGSTLPCLHLLLMCAQTLHNSVLKLDFWELNYMIYKRTQLSSCFNSCEHSWTLWILM